jgi:hypothetical protein
MCFIVCVLGCKRYNVISSFDLFFVDVLSRLGELLCTCSHINRRKNKCNHCFHCIFHFLEDLKCPQNGMAMHNNYPNLYIIIEYVIIKK